jgi:hypothetical protein
MRYMYDAISANAAALESEEHPTMVAIYLTGSAAIRWTSANVAGYKNVVTWVRIDQGGQTSPQYEATVFDVEPGAWTMANAVEATKKCTAPRPTIYCDRSDYKTVPASYTGDLWIAAPGLTDAEAEALAATDKRIVAVQNVWANVYDRSVVVDPIWPEKPVPPKPTGLPTGIAATAFATQSQINAKCNVTDGPETTYEWQLEILGVKGWSLVDTVQTTGPLVSFKNLGAKQHYRFRVTKGTWSEWVNVST